MIPVPMLVAEPKLFDAFTLWSSLIVLFYDPTYAIGTWRAEASLTRPAR